MDLQDQQTRPHETPESQNTEPPTSPKETGLFRGRAILFAILFLFWILFSGRFDAFHLILGLISCAIVTRTTGDLIPELRSPGLAVSWLRFSRYIPWLLWQILVANLHILRIVFHPRMKERINPQILRFQSSLRTEVALVTFANSITLTPGTITIAMSAEGEFKVHAIDDRSGQGFPGPMEIRIQNIFRET